MKKFFKIIALVIAGLLVVVIALVLYVILALPNVGPPLQEYKVELTPEKIERGKYLANHVMLCADCHSVRDFSLFSAPPKPGTISAGGEIFDQSVGFPGVFVSSNITPHGIGEWTDGELLRLITTGVKRDGEPIFPVMPYQNYGKLDLEDIEAVIAYIRSLEPLANELPRSKPDFPFSLIMRTIPEKASFTKRPSPEDKIDYGAYLVTAGACGDCHTRFEKGDFVGEYLAGGREFQMPDGSTLTSSNLTPHESGLKHWTSEMFVQRFKMYGPHYEPEPVAPGEFQTIMPWMMYAGMTEEDLEAIYEYLRTLDPVENFVVKFKSGKP